MRLIGRHNLSPLWQEEESIRKWLTNWAAEICDAHWKRPSDVTNQFPKVRQGPGGCFLFPIAKHPAVIRVLICFPQGVVLITELRASEATDGH